MPTDGAAAEFPDLVIHVGYHKTGTTLLQRSAFTEALGFSSPWPAAFYHQHILLDRPDEGWGERIRRAFRPGIDAARSRGLTPVLSCEELSGDIWRVGQSNGYANFHVAQALSQAFPGARVLLVTREQVSMICSLYKHSVRSHWACTIDSFLDQHPLESGMAPLLNLGYLEYSWLTEAYQRLFGVDHVLTVPYELLTEPDTWATRMGSFLGRPITGEVAARHENAGLNARVIPVKRRLNRLIPETADPNATTTARVINTATQIWSDRSSAEAARRTEARLRRSVETAVGDRFTDDNRRLVRFVGEDWSRFGYRQ